MVAQECDDRLAKVLVWMLFLMFTPFFSLYAGKAELTSYYPSPYGEYMNLKSTNDSYFATSSGNVGVGTTSPGARLTVIGSGNTSASTALEVQNSSAANLLFVRDDGNVGVGTTSPGYKLTVNGQPAANGYTAFTNYSDVRLKENIRQLDGGMLGRIMELHPLTFQYNDKYYQQTGYSREPGRSGLCGFSAQDVKKVFPEMVSEKKLAGGSYLETNLSNLQVYLVKAMQEQQAEIELLKKEIAELKKK